MKKSVLFAIVVILLLSVCVLVFPACDNAPSTNAPSKTCPHQWSEATCLFPKTCRLCYGVEGKALGHAEVIDHAVSSTCTTKGLTEGKHCSTCNEIIVKQAEIDAVGHSWEAATCQKAKTCSVCAEIEGEPLSEHNYINGICIICDQNDPKEEELVSASQAYFYLNFTHELIANIMDSIYGAWYFAIYEADEYLNTTSCLKAFCSNANLEYDDTLIALNDVLAQMGYANPTSMQQLAALRTFSTAVNVVVQLYINYGTYDYIDINISNAKSALKSVTNNYADYTGYSTLKLYYSEVSAYAEFCKAPTGSFNQLNTTIETYETNLRNYKNELSFIFDE